MEFAIENPFITFCIVVVLIGGVVELVKALVH